MASGIWMNIHIHVWREGGIAEWVCSGALCFEGAADIGHITAGRCCQRLDLQIERCHTGVKCADDTGDCTAKRRAIEMAVRIVLRRHNKRGVWIQSLDLCQQAGKIFAEAGQCLCRLRRLWESGHGLQEWRQGCEICIFTLAHEEHEDFLRRHLAACGFCQIIKKRRQHIVAANGEGDHICRA